MVGFPKPSRTERKKDEHARKVAREHVEDAAKAAARRRDKVCRFPLCGCRRLGLRLEVAHDEHKGMGGNPAGNRNVPENLVLMCIHRHQFGGISFHKGTLRADFLTARGFDGPVKWFVNLERDRWTEVAREVSPGILEALAEKQRGLLEALAAMDL
jgi:hypothetical protein